MQGMEFAYELPGCSGLCEGGVSSLTLKSTDRGQMFRSAAGTMVPPFCPCCRQISLQHAIDAGYIDARHKLDFTAREKSHILRLVVLDWSTVLILMRNHVDAGTLGPSKWGQQWRLL